MEVRAMAAVFRFSDIVRLAQGIEGESLFYNISQILFALLKRYGTITVVRKRRKREIKHYDEVLWFLLSDAVWDEIKQKESVRNQKKGHLLKT
ncbi:hypothetical protein, partial [Thermocrinis sp.]|jgi:hypothetical protein|uniref:hypothetical protein n=1 Tax=Thermocrinis sp. TaxID=2024383 RepID=UPI003C06F4F5